MKKIISSWIGIFVGCTILAAGFVYFINPYNLVPGGVYGASICFIICSLLQKDRRGETAHSWQAE